MDLILFFTFIVSGSIYAFRGEMAFALGCFFISAIFWMAYKLGVVAKNITSINAVKELVQKYEKLFGMEKKKNE